VSADLGLEDHALFSVEIRSVLLSFFVLILTEQE